MFQTIAPRPSLEKYVQYFWFGELELSPNQTFTHLATASGSIEWQFHYLGNFTTLNSQGEPKRVFPAGMYGQTNQYNQYVTASRQSGIFAVRLYPHVLPALVGIPAYEITNQSVDVLSLLGREGVELAEKIESSRSFSQRVSIFSDFLENKLIRPRKKYHYLESAIVQIHRSNGQINATTLVNQSCLSQRQFERSFKELAGFSLQSYLKIIRFEAALSLVSAGYASLTELAYQLGYYDQSHFNRDFKRFTGQTPFQFFQTHNGLIV